MINKYIVVGLGGFIGTILRFQINKFINNILHTMNIGTLSVNIIGAFFIGLFSGLISYSIIPNTYKLFLISGILGGLTTFSSFSLEIVQLFQSGKYNLAIVLILLNVGGSIIFTILGLYVTYLLFYK